MSDKLKSDLHFAIVPRWVIRHSELTAQAVRVYAVLADHAAKDGTSFPARSTIARECGGMGVKTVQRALSLLLDHHAVTAEHRDGRPSVYTVHRSPPSGVRSRVTQGEDTGVPTPQDTDVPHKKSQIEEDESASIPKQQHDELWDAFAAIFGDPISKKARARYENAVKTAFHADILPETLAPAASRYRKTWDVACNPQALLDHWNEFGPEAHLRSIPADVRGMYARKRSA